ncbi:helix-turn-helix domain-containing protein [Staphylococcus saprophyticus]|uniref:helix-turn-helix domain-containing protein n=1 Tax=Staphylococcus saprophyticus TaxID=29385 RepID=UPI0034DD1EE7
MTDLTNEETIEIGKVLKNLRKSKNKTTREIAEKLQFSQGHISGIENGKRGKPSIEFLTKYINSLTFGIEEFNYYANKIEKASNKKCKLTLDKKNSDDTFVNNKISLNESVNVLFQRNKLNELESHFFEIPINDLNYQLYDIDNTKVYKGLGLSDLDRKNIDVLINNYLIQKLEIQKENVNFNYENNLMNKDNAESVLNKLNNLIERLNSTDKYNY